MKNQTFDILSTGELLIDFISKDFASSFEEVKNFERLPGGSPANVCMNMARLGNATQLVATLGNDDMGNYLYNYVKAHEVGCDYLARVKVPTTLILVTRTQAIANFEAYRGADTQITAVQFPDALLQNSRIFHTTCFALSQNPAQTAILEAAERAVSFGTQLSIDANYAQKIWTNRLQAQQTIAKFCQLGTLIKVSEVDWERLYETPLKDAEKAAEHFLNLGARTACITLGSEGCLVANQTERHFLPARKVEVKDTTGAGDAFWSGFLTAWLDQHPLFNCAKAGRKMAELKLGYFGPLPKKVARTRIYEDF